MYLWDVNKLSEQLITNSVTEKDKMKYLIGYITIGAISGEVSYWSGVGMNSLNYFDYLNGFISVLLTIIGTFICYRANQVGDGQKFVERFICLSVPIIIRIIIIGFPVAIGIYIAADLFVMGGKHNFENGADSIQTLLILFYLVIYFYWIRKLIITISSKKEI
jgi:H+/Cl- antiporter ClcA